MQTRTRNTLTPGTVHDLGGALAEATEMVILPGNGDGILGAKPFLGGRIPTGATKVLVLGDLPTPARAKGALPKSATVAATRTRRATPTRSTRSRTG